MNTTMKLDTFRRTMAGVCWMLAPLVLALTTFVHPGQDEGGIVQTMVESPGRVEAASLLVILSSLMFVPALVGVLRLLPGRGALFGHVGVGLAIIGVVGHAVWAGFEVVLAWLAGSDIDRAQLSAVVDGGPPSGIALSIILLMFLTGFFLGLIVLAIGLLRSRTVPWWAAVLLIVGPLSDFLPTDNEAVLLAGYTLFVIGCGVIGLSLMRTLGFGRVPSRGAADTASRPVLH